ncbi:MAG: hypothetical protein AAGH79_14535, partial [Bacteroidota bacterium]
QGMKTTFCGVVWDLSEQKIYYTNLGDSRIYEISNLKCRQISTDEVKSVILRKKDGKPMIISGVAVTAEGVTNVIGSPEATMEIKMKSDEDIRGIVLSTDGLHGLSTKFEEALIKATNALDLEYGLEEMCQAYRDLQKDDMTILAIRKVTTASDRSEKMASLLQNADLPSLSPFELSNVLLQGIEEGIRETDAARTSKLLEITKAKGIDFGRERLGRLISFMRASNFQNGPIYQKLLLMLKKSKF